MGRIAKGVALAVLTAYVVVSLYPFVWMASGAFKDRRDVLQSASPVPDHPSLGAFRDVWRDLDFPRLLFNSARITVLDIVLILFVFPLAAYAFAVLRFPGRRLLYLAFVAALLVPGITVLLPLVILDTKLGLADTPWAIVFPLANAAGPVAVLLLKSYFEAIPRELHEAARLDGYGELRIYRKVYYPLARPALITVAVLNVVASWNEYVLPSVTINSPGQRTLPLGLQNLLSTNVVQWNQVMAAALILVVPVIVMYVLLQRYVTDGLRGAVKG
jgi:multiple sugar transport system permease protein